MASFVAANLAPIIFASLVLFLLLGYPMAFPLTANGLAFFALATLLSPHAPEAINLNWPLLRTLPDHAFGVLANEVLLAIPFFTFMGLISLLIVMTDQQLGRQVGDMYEGVLRLTGADADKTRTNNDYNKEEMP